MAIYVGDTIVKKVYIGDTEITAGNVHVGGEGVHLYTYTVSFNTGSLDNVSLNSTDAIAVTGYVGQTFTYTRTISANSGYTNPVFDATPTDSANVDYSTSGTTLTIEITIPQDGGSETVTPDASAVSASNNLSVTITGVLNNATRSTNSLTIPSGESKTFTVSADSHYEFTGVAASDATESSVYITSIDESLSGNTFTYTINAATFSGDQTATVSNTATATAITYSGDLVFTVPSNVGAISNIAYSGNNGDSVNYNVTLNANTDYEFSDGETTKDVSGSATIDAGGNIAVNLNTAANAVSQTEYSGSITYATASNVTASITPTSYTDEVVGTTFSYSGTINAAQYYEFSDGTTSINKSGTTAAVPSGGGNFQGASFTSDTVSGINYSGSISYSNQPSNTSLGTCKTSYSGVYDTPISYSCIVNANTGYEFGDGTTSKTVSGSFDVPGGGGTVTRSLSSAGSVSLKTYTVSFSFTNNVSGASNATFTNDTQSSRQVSHGGSTTFSTVTASANTGYSFTTDFATSGSYTASNVTSNQTVSITGTGTVTETLYTATYAIDNMISGPAAGYDVPAVPSTQSCGIATQYSFTDPTLPSAKSGYTFSSGPAWSGDSLSGTCTADTTVTRDLTGTIALDNQAPTAVITGNSTGNTGGLGVPLSGTSSSDPDGDSLTYTWTIDTNGGGCALSSTSGSTTSISKTSAGSCTVGLVVNDGSLNSTKDQHTVTFSAAATCSTYTFTKTGGFFTQWNYTNCSGSSAQVSCGSGCVSMDACVQDGTTPTLSTGVGTAVDAGTNCLF